MKNYDDIMNSPKIKKMLSELKDKVHVPFELIIAYAQEKLSSEGHSKIESHIKACKECEEVFQLVKESLSSEEKADKSDGVSNIPISLKLQPKLKLVAAVNSKRDEIAEKTAKLLLPKESWFAVKPGIAAYRNWLKTSMKTSDMEREELAVAAFTGGDSEDREDFEIIISVVKFSDYICDLLTERCDNLSEIERKLLEFVNDGMAIFDEIEFAQTIKDKILQLLTDIVST